ncbi:Paf1 complex component [Malassezia vespertilionis]|uniref:Leo1p n=1 Tax=Malassezia vespertilionis TaxID=2020962 RepID=A0A2N1J809_9BASI|nr:Paf1 complex component [Malassezia vespertilionis]PKI82673.1 hypothetical protein MVES_003456 [Malassezia vespertilionis]WFD08526.1 Paf1 complex component [Malassezia vespertilionis]
MASPTQTLADDLFGDSDNEAPAAQPQFALSLSGDSMSEDADREKEALEYLEDDQAPAAPTAEEQTAWINVAQVPVRHTKTATLARLPHFVRYSDKVFDETTWDEQEEEQAFYDGDGEIGDRDARSILRTSNTVRWRWRDSIKGPTPESNARIVRWSDGSESLQLGNEFLDVTRTNEPCAQAADGTRIPLTYLYVPHPREGVLQAEGVVDTVLSFKPNVHSDTHNKLASAIKHQRSARVVAGQEMFGLDPEREKERIERQLKESEKKKNRERIKAMREENDLDGDLDFSARRRGAQRTTRDAVDWSGDEAEAEGAGARQWDYDDEDDGFIVHDETDEEKASEDEMERADRNLEASERKRREEGNKRPRPDDEDSS